MTEKRFERIYADVDVFCKDHNAKGLSQLIEREDYDTIVDLLNELSDENEQLKQSSTMYHNLFLELQKMMKGVKKASDLDSKDFEDLIELSKGNVFDDELGWIHLPVKGDFE